MIVPFAICVSDFPNADPAKRDNQTRLCKNNFPTDRNNATDDAKLYFSVPHFSVFAFVQANLTLSS
jgi:hypothetical protein